MAARILRGCIVLCAVVLAPHVAMSAETPALSSLLQSRVVNYKPYSEPRTAPEQKGGILALHVEDVYEGIHLETYGERHGEAAAEVMDRAADIGSGRDIDVRLLDINLFDLEPRSWNPQNTEAAIDAFISAKVVSTSETGPTPADQDEFMTTLWHESDAVVVLSAGNDGAGTKDKPVRQDYNYMQLADALLRVGSVGQRTVKKESSCNGPDLVARSPFDEGMTFQYYKSPDEMRTDMMRHYTRIQGAHMAAVSEVEQISDNRVFMEASQLTEIQQKKVFQVQVDRFADKANQFISLDGASTSFASPVVAGHIAAARELYPDLKDMDLVAAALFSASRYPLKRRNNGEALAYQKNSRGLLFNETCAGFGLFRPEPFHALVKNMSDALKANPALQTVPKHIVVTQTQPGVFKVAEQAVALAAVIDVELADTSAQAPRVLTLVDPEGKEIQLFPGVAGDGRLRARTSFVFGTHTAGEWIVRVPEGYEISDASLSIQAVENGGMIDTLIAKDGNLTAQ